MHVFSVAAVQCPLLSAPVNGKVTFTNNRVYPSTAIFSCNAGYVLTQPSSVSRACVAVGPVAEWSGALAECARESAYRF